MGSIFNRGVKTYDSGKYLQERNVEAVTAGIMHRNEM